MQGLIGTDWLISQITKSLSISPLLSRWILFIGYRERLRARLLPQIAVDGLDNYRLSESVRLNTQPAYTSLATQVATSLSVSHFLLVEHEILPFFAEYFALEFTKEKRSKGVLSSSIPVMITASDWKGSIAASASNVLRNDYSVPLDGTEVIIGQMEKGGMVFIVQGLDLLGERLPPVLDDIQRTVDMKIFNKCYVVGCCKSATDPLLGNSSFLHKVVLRSI